MHYILFYKTVKGYIEKRARFREEHLKPAQSARDNGSLVMAGALADPAPTWQRISRTTILT